MSEIPKIETFEHDIVSEVQNKNTSIADIASYGGELNNKESEKKRRLNSIFVISSGALISLTIVIIILYVFFSKTTNQTVAENPQSKLIINNGSREKIVYLLPNLNSNVGDFISNFEETPFGYDVTISDFRQVYAFVLNNEKLIAEDMLGAFKINVTSDTIKNLVFADVTESNQNMRVLEIGNDTLVYAFSIDGKHLLISKSIKDILSMRNAIIK